MKIIKLIKSGNSESLGDYEYKIGEVRIHTDTPPIVRVNFEFIMPESEVESFVENLKELLGV